MSTADQRFDDFVAFSSVLTGFAPYDLRGTGQAELYLSTLDDVVGEQIVTDLLGSFRSVTAGSVSADDHGTDDTSVERGLRRELFSDPRLGPVARGLIKLWYVGTWYELPGDWRESYGESELDRTFVVSARSYTEGLVWPAIGANPPGAKPFGYGMWATPPRVDVPELPA